MFANSGINCIKSPQFYNKLSPRANNPAPAAELFRMFFSHCVEPEGNGSINANRKVVVHDVDWNVIIYVIVIIVVAWLYVG